MLIYFAADHRGFELKETLKAFIKDLGYEVVDVGNTKYDGADDYPDFASLASRKVGQDPENSRGVVICGSGVGVDIVANKHKNVRSVLASSADQAIASRADDDTNVLAIGADYIPADKAKEILKAWLEEKFSGEERHQRRLEKIRRIENSR